MTNSPAQTNLRNLSYVGMPLDRNSVLREDSQWMTSQYQSPQALFQPLYHHANLVSGQSASETPKAIYLKYSEIPPNFHQSCQLVYLGDLKGGGTNHPIFAIDLSVIPEETVNEWRNRLKVTSQFTDLRRMSAFLLQSEAAILGYARGLCFWHQNHLFCSRCGHTTVSTRGGHMRKCTNDTCAKEVYPRIDPAVIMLVELIDPTDGIEKCLLGRHKGLPKGIYSTLAGYVDQGESMEEAVAREVMEEAGLLIHNADYIASQPWPFPSALMIGFRAQTKEENITIALDELEDAQWFSADQIRQFGEHTDTNVEKALPRKDSIARTLIELWLQDKTSSLDLSHHSSTQ